MIYRTYRAPTYKEAVLSAKMELGNDTYILGRKSVKEGGIFGLFRKNLTEITVAKQEAPPAGGVRRATKQKPKEAISLPQFRPGVNGFYLNHLSFPTEVSVDPKQPISRMQIQMIEKKIDEKALKVINNESKQRQDSRTPELKIA